MRKTWALVAAIALGLLLAVYATVPPRPLPVSAPSASFSAARAMLDVREIAKTPHPTGSVENARVRAFLAARLSALGAQVHLSTQPLQGAPARSLIKWSGAPAPAQVTNVVGVVPGRDRAAPAVVLMAHYDTVWASPGAADDSAGVAASLEIVRALKIATPASRDLIVLLTDGEELGLVGAKGWFAQPVEAGHVGSVVNLESRGGGGRAAMFETGRRNGEMVRLYARAVRHPSATSFSTFVYELLPNNTDFTPAKKAGLQGLNFAFIGRPEQYHSPSATPERLDQGALQDMGAQALDSVRALLNDSPLGPAPNEVFFDVFSLFLVHYPPVWGWAVLAAAAGLLAFAAGRSREQLRRIAVGAGASLALMLATGVLLFTANLLSGAGKGANYYDRLAATPLLMVQAGLLVVAVLALSLVWARGRDDDGARTSVGLALPVLVLGVVAQAAAPLIAFLITWPLLLAGAAAALTKSSEDGPRRWAAVGVCAVGFGYVLSIAFFLFQGLGQDMPWVMALFAGLAAPLLAPFTQKVARDKMALWAAVLIVAGLAVASWVRLDPVSPTVAPYSLKASTTAGAVARDPVAPARAQ